MAGTFDVGDVFLALDKRCPGSRHYSTESHRMERCLFMDGCWWDVCLNCSYKVRAS